MSSSAIAAAMPAVRKCAFCAEEILAGAKKCKHFGEFVKPSVSIRVGVIFALGVMIACILAGSQPQHSEAILAVGVWAIFALLFAKLFRRA